jgi:creatinine amidohydrolase
LFVPAHSDRLVVEYGMLTFEEIREAISRGAVAVVPTGCTEQQGPHLSVDFDTWFAYELMKTAAEKAYRRWNVEALVLPAMPFGPTPEHRNYGAGFVDIPPELHEELFYYVLKSLADQGFRKILCWPGCGGHRLHGTVERINREGRAMAVWPEQPYYRIWCRLGDPSVPCGHADSFTTSIALYKRPKTVRTGRIINPQSREPDWDSPDLDFARYSSTGVIGDPTHASRKLGEKLWKACVDEAAEMIRKVAELSSAEV